MKRKPHTLSTAVRPWLDGITPDGGTIDLVHDDGILMLQLSSPIETLGLSSGLTSYAHDCKLQIVADLYNRQDLFPTDDVISEVLTSKHWGLPGLGIGWKISGPALEFIRILHASGPKPNTEQCDAELTTLQQKVTELMRRKHTLLEAITLLKAVMKDAYDAQNALGRLLNEPTRLPMEHEYLGPAQREIDDIDRQLPSLHDRIAAYSRAVTLFKAA